MACANKCGKRKPNDISNNNGFLNFLKEYSKEQCGKSAIQIIMTGAKCWNCMSEKNKKIYKSPAPKKKNPCLKKKKDCPPKIKACPKKKKIGCPKKKRCPPKKKACGVKKPRCTNSGPIINNTYLNYVRVFRHKNCGLEPRVIIKNAAKCWCKLTPEQRLKYQKQGENACLVTTSRPKKNTLLRKCARKSKKKKKKTRRS